MNDVFSAIASGKVKRTEMQRMIDKDSRKYGKFMQRLALSDNKPKNLIEAFRSENFLAQVYREGDYIRISVNTAKIDKNGTQWKDGIAWDDLQRIKSEIGYGDKAAVEVYPPDDKVVNVANMRHLFVLPELPAFMWRSPHD